MLKARPVVLQLVLTVELIQLGEDFGPKLFGII